MTRERVNYIISEGKYTGYSVNMPFIVGQCDSINELSNAMRVMLKEHIKYLNDLLSQEEPFEFKQAEGNTFIDS